MNKKYKHDSFGDRSDSLKSARIIVPIVLGFLQPKSVVDVGCGTGEFLSVFKEEGIKNIFGLDGPWVNTDKLRIQKEYFKHVDLEKPVHINKKFDLAVSLEVAEHLSKDSATTFVNTLTSFSPIILFSAAIPFQGGLHHINEQWPEYWVNLFAKKNYVPIDCIRKKIWKNDDVSFWYSQNILLFVEKDYLKTDKKLEKEFEQTEPSALSIVHPKQYLHRAKILNHLVKLIPRPIKWIIIKIMSFFK
jgi:SAM-dependent methyltransferase